jgi:hypothetical protein
VNGIDRIAAENLRAEQAAAKARRERVLANAHSAYCGRPMECQAGITRVACLRLRDAIRAAYGDSQ